MRIAFAAQSLPSKGALVVGLDESGKLSASAADLDKKTGGAIRRAVAASRFKGKKGEIRDILAPPKLNNSRILIVGLGNPKDLSEADVEDVGGGVLAKLQESGEKDAGWLVDPLGKGGAMQTIKSIWT